MGFEPILPFWGRTHQQCAPIPLRQFSKCRLMRFLNLSILRLFSFPKRKRLYPTEKSQPSIEGWYLPMKSIPPLCKTVSVSSYNISSSKRCQRKKIPLFFRTPTGIRIPILALEGPCPIQLNDRGILLIYFNSIVLISLSSYSKITTS